MTAHRARREKLARLHAGASPRSLDLFAGCGGLSLGFDVQGFDLVAAVENDPHAARSHATNFFGHLSPELKELHGRPRDITVTDPEDIVREYNLGAPELAVDVIVGGPPCQAFARVGRAKLREVAAHPEAFRQDPRANLYLRYLHYVKVLQPLALLIENVPDVVNFGGHNIADEICDALEEEGYVCGYTLLNAAYYGVPQMRERMFLIAYAEEVGSAVSFPAPSSWLELPRGYEGTRAVALKGVEATLLDSGSPYYQAAPAASKCLPSAVSARDALCDLPPITLHLEGKMPRGARRFTELASYRSDMEPTQYARRMREWPGFESETGVYDHVIRSLPRDYPIFRRMNPGDQYPEAYRHAIKLFEEKLAFLQTQGIDLKPGTRDYDELRAEMVPPYDPGKFPNKWRKLEADRPARTLMAHLGKDSYSHIHYDSDQARTISVREAARLQSFPDGFVFDGTMNPAFRQIGNAVPPLLGSALASNILDALRQ